MDQQRILITGASGFVGGHLCRYFAKNAAIVGACYRSHQVSSEIKDLVRDSFSLDLSNRSEVEQVISFFRPDIIVNCAALSKSASCETDPKEARRSNVDAIRHLIDVNSMGGNCRLIHLSTDLVFDALAAPKGGFLEGSAPQALSVYGQSKLDAERVVLGCKQSVAVCRLSLVYGNSINGRGGFMGWVTSGLKSQQAFDLFIDEWRTPVLVEDVCRAIKAVACKERLDSKIFHLSGSERIDRYSFGLQVAEVFGYSPDCINAARLADFDSLAPRSSDASLNNFATCRELGISFFDVNSGLKRMKASF
jgi:dTDP-4-dehydrorhamnose reductase